MDEIDTALINSQRIVDWERALGIFNEVGTAILGPRQRRLDLGAQPLLLLWALLGHGDSPRLAIRCSLRLLRAGAPGAHHLHRGRVDHPCEFSTLAPPRWFPQHGFADTLQIYGPKIYDSETIANTANQIAAMPSLHVGWALIAGWAITASTKSRWRWLGYAHPITMTLAVVVTANHWWLDVIGAATLVYAAILADRPIQRRIERRQLATSCRIALVEFGGSEGNSEADTPDHHGGVMAEVDVGRDLVVAALRCCL